MNVMGTFHDDALFIQAKQSDVISKVEEGQLINSGGEDYFVHNDHDNCHYNTKI